MLSAARLNAVQYRQSHQNDKSEVAGQWVESIIDNEVFVFYFWKVGV